MEKRDRPHPLNNNVGPQPPLCNFFSMMKKNHMVENVQGEDTHLFGCVQEHQVQMGGKGLILWDVLYKGHSCPAHWSVE